MRTPNASCGGLWLPVSLCLRGCLRACFGVCLCIFAAKSAAATHPEQARFSSQWDGRWQASKVRERCLLELDIADYGSARFVAYPGQSLHFELVGRRDLLANHGVSARTVAPAWHPRYPHKGNWATVTHVPGYGVQLQGTVATRLLMDFYEGYEQQLGANGVYGNQPELLLTLSVLKFRAAYDDFMRCQQGARPDSLLALHRTRVQFDTAESVLWPKQSKRLRQVAAYVQQNPKVTRVYVDGYTDDIGTDKANVALSKRRANVVADLLASAGVDRSLLQVRYHGERYPVSAQGSDSARARNRRTTVRVETGNTDLAAQR